MRDSAFKRPRESSIGVGSVVLHLRKNKNIGEPENLYQSTVQSDDIGDDIDTINSGERKISSPARQMSPQKRHEEERDIILNYTRAELPKTVTVSASPRLDNETKKSKQASQKPSTSAASQAIKNGKVLRQ